MNLKLKSMTGFLKALDSVSDAEFKSVVRDYYRQCCIAYDTEFKVWRQQIKNLKAEGLVDVMDGWYTPYLKSRIITSFDSI